MPRGWPPLEHRDVLAIVHALGFAYSHTRGGHAYYKGQWGGQARTCTVSTHVKQFGPDLLKFIVNQIGCTRKEFYGATPQTACKIR
jgi:predicted RNA binding protein YcfA (HicA-like mRNA interferase family)